MPHDAKVEVLAVNLLCPHCGAAVQNPINGRAIIDCSALEFMADELICEGDAQQSGCGQRFRLPEIARNMRRVPRR